MKLSHIIVITICSVAFSMHVVAQEPSASGEILKSCPLPNKPTIPNGRNSSEAEMIAAQTGMKAYIAEGDKVITCLNKLEASWGEEVSDEQKAIIVLFHNKMVEEMESIAELFNSAVRAYKGKNPS